MPEKDLGLSCLRWSKVLQAVAQALLTIVPALELVAF